MSYNTWWKKNIRKLGIVSLDYDLDRCWKASRTETKAAFKRKVLEILQNNPRCDDYYYDLKDKIEKL